MRFEEIQFQINKCDWGTIFHSFIITNRTICIICHGSCRQLVISFYWVVGQNNESNTIQPSQSVLRYNEQHIIIYLSRYRSNLEPITKKVSFSPNHPDWPAKMKTRAPKVMAQSFKIITSNLSHQKWSSNHLDWSFNQPEWSSIFPK